jgi:hypothetical protein
MAVRLFKVEKFPRRIAISGVDTFIVGGAFFLDFSRPLVLRRYLGVGPVWGMFVPVIHEGEREGTYLVDVDKDNAYFADIQELWRQRFPSTAPRPEFFARRQDILAHFAAQFSTRTR